MSQTIGELAVARPASVKVFQRHGVDFCCGGHKPLVDTCRAKGLDADALLAEIDAEEQRGRPSEVTWDQAPLPELIAHILAKHHRPLDEELPRVLFLARKVARVHGGSHAHLPVLQGRVEELVDDLVPHMAKEEQVLFPWILRGDGARAKMPVTRMEEEHDRVGELLREIRSLTGGFVVPTEACGSWRALWQGLEALEVDLHEHIHLENNVLFPRALRGD
jgi:regulator of cell morphogenesis and NO signaling